MDVVKQLVVKSNVLVESKYKLTVREQKIVLYLISQIKKDDAEFKIYTLPIKEFSEMMGLKGYPKYTEIREITDQLQRKLLKMTLGKKIYSVNWLSLVVYNSDEGTIDFRFDPFLKPYLLELQKNFTSYQLQNVLKLNSSYAIRLYEILKQYEKIKERKISLLELREMLGATDIYPGYGNFKQRVITPAQKELKAKTDLSFEIEELKAGKKVTDLIFIISSNSKKIVVESLPLFGLDNQDYFSTQLKLFAEDHKVTIDEKTIESWKTYDESRVIELMDSIRDRDDIEYPIAYINSVLKKTDGEVAASVDPVEQIVARFIKDYGKRRDTVTKWLIEEKLKNSLITEGGLNKEESELYVKEYGKKVINDIQAKVKANRTVKR